MLEAGVSYFLDLTEPGEYAIKPYTPILLEEASALDRSGEHLRIAIADCSTPRVGFSPGDDNK